MPNQYDQSGGGNGAGASRGAARDILEYLYGPHGAFASARNPVAHAGSGFGDFIYGTDGTQYRTEHPQHGRPVRAPAVNPFVAAYMSLFAESMNPTPPGLGGMFGGLNPSSFPAPAIPVPAPTPPINTPQTAPVPTPTPSPSPVPTPQATPAAMIPWLRR